MSATKSLAWIFRNRKSIQKGGAVSFAQWKKAYDTCIQLEASSFSQFDKAVLGGALSKYPAFAFAAGYQSAIRTLVPDITKLDNSNELSMAAFCITEKQGNRPRNIDTCIKDGHITGSKSFVSCGMEAKYVLVAAKNGSEINDRATPKLKMVLLSADGEGVRLQRKPEMSFIPEISHAELHMTATEIKPVHGVEAILPGDGYDCYMKPFRTIEDTYVTAALLGYHMSLSLDLNLPSGHTESLMNQILALSALSELPPADDETHLALAGTLRLVDSLLDPTHIAAIGPSTIGSDEFARWNRDAKLLTVANSIREARTKRAWQNINRRDDPTV
ncbi:hypothetical protein SARC_02568 [Sphaeroforma arctica JP610]|uniref:Uncharacterized protein n=1 Tax=Sphaeroforma arctica JP610 TaxID=667725 RepID=A0A0L0GAF8_9EUKA|nr:hypothetical protein SARC_02568 [Sphaeroforma arctica JP610]KNC85233.1 hypothetical protein SARC_02568 [Sphaeroforma arctica JP610]|eukprot:XP_014159135.1 hypothetical protein SARC_02568 [Sphaeroforma arctica JP610]